MNVHFIWDRGTLKPAADHGLFPFKKKPCKVVFIGTALPGIATFILFFLGDLSEEKPQKIEG